MLQLILDSFLTFVIAIGSVAFAAAARHGLGLALDGIFLRVVPFPGFGSLVFFCQTRC